MADLRSLYQEVILDHNKNPRNYGKLHDANREADGYNPLCGDKFKIYLKLVDGLISDIRFEGVGCAISKASASVMSTVVKGKTIEEAESFFESFHRLVTGDAEALLSAEKLGKLAAFAGVSEYPARVKCASLAWHTMKSAIRKESEVVSTE